MDGGSGSLRAATGLAAIVHPVHGCHPFLVGKASRFLAKFCLNVIEFH
jgi:hypothetical protein